MVVKSADRALQILEFLGKRHGGLKHIDLHNSLKILTSSLSGLLATLVAKEHFFLIKKIIDADLVSRSCSLRLSTLLTLISLGLLSPSLKR